MGLKFFDLFAGIGGFRLGMERAGHTCVGSCEWDDYARETYKKNFGSYPEYDDAKDLHAQSLPSFDVLCAGFPCQAFSIAGKRLGFEDTRGTIFFEIARIAKEKRPSYLLLENVRGLLSHDKGRTFATIISTLDALGYDAEWQVLNSKYFVPQNRERVFIIGHLRGERTRQIFPLGDFNSETDKPKLKQIGNVDTKGHNSLWGRVYDPNGIAPNLNANGGGMGAKTGLYGIVNDKGNLREVEQSTCLDANYWKGCDNHAQRTMIAWSSSGRSWGREERIKIGEANTLNTGDGCRTQSSATFVYMSNTNANMKKRVQDRKESWTLGTGTDFGIKDGIRIRKLTPIECERLQGFPDNWTRGSDTQRYKQCGNAVTVPVVEYIAKELRLG
jgi:DNA (cytosine-5)-methyltransferase 1